MSTYQAVHHLVFNSRYSSFSGYRFYKLGAPIEYE